MHSLLTMLSDPEIANMKVLENIRFMLGNAGKTPLTILFLASILRSDNNLWPVEHSVVDHDI